MEPLETDRTRLRPLTDGYRMWAVELKATGAVVGLCGLFPHSLGYVELGYVSRYDRRRQGLASEAAAAVLAAAESEAQEVVATIRPDNIASIGVARRLGLEQTEEIEDEHGVLLVFARPFSAEEETRAILSDPNALAAIEEAVAASNPGDYITADELRALLLRDAGRGRRGLPGP